MRVADIGSVSVCVPSVPESGLGSASGLGIRVDHHVCVPPRPTIGRTPPRSLFQQHAQPQHGTVSIEVRILIFIFVFIIDTVCERVCIVVRFLYAVGAIAVCTLRNLLERGFNLNSKQPSRHPADAFCPSGAVHLKVAVAGICSCPPRSPSGVPHLCLILWSIRSDFSPVKSNTRAPLRVGSPPQY
jgi:hypothetical protein